jgi:hypothetical protein
LGKARRKAAALLLREGLLAVAGEGEDRESLALLDEVAVGVIAPQTIEDAEGRAGVAGHEGACEGDGLELAAGEG